MIIPVVTKIVMVGASFTIWEALDFDFGSVIGLSTEVMEKLKKIRPYSLGQASRISGITPAAISILMVNLKKQGYL